MSAGDSHLVINLIMIELLGTVFFLAIVTVCLYIKRYFVRKSLSGLKALITNGDTKLSQELAEQLSKKHNCHVILVKGNNACNGGSTSAATSAPQFGLNGSTQAGISVLHCDISNNEDLEQFSQTVHDSFNGIDIVIDNATNNIFEAIRSDNFQTFIDVTSGKLRTTINMLMHFIPKIKYSTCGHFVTIQPIISNKKPLLSSYGEIKTLINLLADNQSTFALDLFNRQQKIHLTTVMWNCDNRQLNTNEANCNGNNNIDSGGHSKIKEISERIINGIKADRSVVNINKSFSPFNSIRNYFRKKSANTLSSNCNNHKRVS